MYWVFILHLFSLIVILDMLSALVFFLVLIFRHFSCTLSLFCRFPQTHSFIIFRFLKMPARYFFPYHNLKRAGCLWLLITLVWHNLLIASSDMLGISLTVLAIGIVLFLLLFDVVCHVTRNKGVINKIVRHRNRRRKYSKCKYLKRCIGAVFSWLSFNQKQNPRNYSCLSHQMWTVNRWELEATCNHEAREYMRIGSSAGKSATRCQLRESMQPL